MQEDLHNRSISGSRWSLIPLTSALRAQSCPHAGTDILRTPLSVAILIVLTKLSASSQEKGQLPSQEALCNSLPYLHDL